ncbi:MAG: hypothetical protein AAF739_03950 [Pseudomonadota bacterium]
MTTDDGDIDHLEVNQEVTNAKRMPLVPFLLKHLATGFVCGAAFVAAILVFNVGNLGTLIMGADVAVLAIFLLALFVGSTFASVQAGIAIMFKTDELESISQRAPKRWSKRS